ncbi:MAG: methyltransferase domain-containing protein [Deltaproteobacteria bacterium]|nr:methyltransferase domain-containing protein [Deltaproteobacteria bacterium]
MKPRVDDVAAWNERWARDYDIDRYYAQAHWLVRWVEARRVEVAVQLLAAGPEDLVVELGCGAGHVLGQCPGRLVGLEIAPTMLLKSRRRLGARAALVRADVEQLPLQSARLTRLVCTEVIEHVVDPRRLLEEIARVLAPHGSVVITFPNEALIEALKRWALRLRLFRRLAPGPTVAAEADWHLHSFSPELFRRLQPAALELLATRAVPSALLPLRYVCLLRRREE